MAGGETMTAPKTAAGIQTIAKLEILTSTDFPGFQYSVGLTSRTPLVIRSPPGIEIVKNGLGLSLCEVHQKLGRNARGEGRIC